MKFTIQEDIQFPLEDVFRVQRDELEALSDYLPTVDEIVVDSREEDGDVVRLVNLWKGSSAEIPGIARPFIKPEMLNWIDRAEWNSATHVCNWETEVGFLPDAVEAAGTTRFEYDGETTTVIIEGEITIHARRIPGIPRIAAGKVGKAVEKFVVKMIEPNLRETTEAIGRYLEDQQE